MVDEAAAAGYGARAVTELSGEVLGMIVPFHSPFSSSHLIVLSAGKQT